MQRKRVPSGRRTLNIKPKIIPNFNFQFFGSHLKGWLSKTEFEKSLDLRRLTKGLTSELLVVPFFVPD